MGPFFFAWIGSSQSLTCLEPGITAKFKYPVGFQTIGTLSANGTVSTNEEWKIRLEDVRKRLDQKLLDDKKNKF